MGLRTKGDEGPCRIVPGIFPETEEGGRAGEAGGKGWSGQCCCERGGGDVIFQVAPRGEKPFEIAAVLC